MYKDDLKKQIEPEKHASLAHSSEGLAAKKAEIVKTTNHFVDALESLSVQDMDSMRADFEEPLQTMTSAARSYQAHRHTPREMTSAKWWLWGDDDDDDETQYTCDDGRACTDDDGDGQTGEDNDGCAAYDS